MTFQAILNASRIGLDTVPIIYFVEQHPTYSGVVRRILQHIDASACAFASAIALTEVLVRPIQMDNSSLVAEYTALLTTSRHFQLIDVSQSIAAQAARLRASYGLKTPDAIHIATAIAANCDIFVTNDLHLKRVTDITVVALDDLLALS
ncbi:MAG TPA: PIN domain-containing protein [Capsulimonadaceae bacterium]|jgi:predicted nucleic acid-binding protein